MLSTALEDGNVPGLDLPIKANPAIVWAIGVFLKRDFQKIVLARVPRGHRSRPPVVRHRLHPRRPPRPQDNRGERHGRRRRVLGAVTPSVLGRAGRAPVHQFVVLDAARGEPFEVGTASQWWIGRITSSKDSPYVSARYLKDDADQRIDLTRHSPSGDYCSGSVLPTGRLVKVHGVKAGSSLAVHVGGPPWNRCASPLTYFRGCLSCSPVSIKPAQRAFAVDPQATSRAESQWSLLGSSNPRYTPPLLPRHRFTVYMTCVAD